MFEAKEFQNTNREEALQIIAKAIDDTPESVGIGIDAVDYLNLERNVEAMHRATANDDRYPHEKHTGHNIEHLHGATNLIAVFYLSRGQISKYPDFDTLVEARFLKELLNEQ